MPDAWRISGSRALTTQSGTRFPCRQCRNTGLRVPIYVNIRYPWTWHGVEPNPPFVPEDDPNNTVNSYRREFEVPQDWKGRRVLLTFDGVNSFFQLWVNGEKVGLGKDSRTPVEFDITAFVKPGKNLLAVENFRWCDGSYLEDQDMCA